MRGREFARCAECGHAGVVRAAAACLGCGGQMRAEPAPPDLFGGWRCACYHCVSTPC